ncbi:MAG: hypothetical protein EG822_02115 [Deltaproteobacteria bacterium]|nr:hypothetical protein [Deltaproteobacteria bacterium]TLN04251.1 MAG: hypothetical protein FDZ73_04010 [bacterium]
MDPIRNKLFLTDLIKMDFPQSVFEEVQQLISQVYLDYDFSWLSRVFKDVVNLYNGSYPGYRPCSTHYHDLKHITDGLLALASLINGAHASGVSFREKQVTLALIAIMFHEAGYIQRNHDTTGTGAKYTLVRLERTLEFVNQYFATHGYDATDCELCCTFIKSTDMTEDLESLPFSSEGELTLARMIATADIIGQIADRTYLEKLLFLFQELSEVHVLGFKTELDLMENTLDSFRQAQHRMEHDLGNVKIYFLPHFMKRWEIDYDMYDYSIESNISYLSYLLENHRSDYREKLQRGGLMKRLALMESANND